MKGTPIVFHGNCPDGYAAMFACWQCFGEHAQYIPVLYGQAPPEIPMDHNIYIVDFAYSAYELRQLWAARQGRRHGDESVVVVLDHHVRAERDLAELTAEGVPGLLIRFDVKESGATLTWKYLHGYDRDTGESIYRADQLEAMLPTFYKYVRDRDLWRWELPDSKPMSLAYWCMEKDPLSIEQFAQNLEEAEGYETIVAQGTAMGRYADSLVREQAGPLRVQTGMIGGYRVPVVNTSTLFSEVGDYLCTTQPDIPFAAYYFDRADGKRQWGLRGHGTIDLSLVAKHYGGGGHANAAGFVSAQNFTGDAP